MTTWCYSVKGLGMPARDPCTMTMMALQNSNYYSKILHEEEESRVDSAPRSPHSPKPTCLRHHLLSAYILFSGPQYMVQACLSSVNVREQVWRKT